jgi:hypothetical protein
MLKIMILKIAIFSLKMFLIKCSFNCLKILLKNELKKLLSNKNKLKKRRNYRCTFAQSHKMIKCPMPRLDFGSLG